MQKVDIKIMKKFIVEKLKNLKTEWIEVFSQNPKILKNEEG